MADSTGVTTHAYDPAGRTTSVAYPTGKALTHAYDGNRNRTTMLDPDGGMTTYLYDQQDRLTTIANPFAELTTIAYDPLSRDVSQTMANGVTTSQLYDPAGRLTAKADWAGASALAAYTATYDPAGNRLAVADIDGNRVTYTYDATNQLLTERRTGTMTYAATYTYDPLGNRLTASQSGAAGAGVTTYTYNAANALTGWTPPIAAPVTVTYDPNRNAIGAIQGGALTSFTYDFENRMTSAAYPTGLVETYTYSADNKRQQKNSTSGGVTNFLWDGDNVLLEMDASLATQAHYSDFPGTWEWKLSQRRAGVSSFYIYDASANARMLCNASGAVTDEYIYDAFGNILNSAQPTTNYMLFVGRHGVRLDNSAAGAMYDARRRKYLALVGRWASRDPIGFDGGVNEYGFVGNNPVAHTDARGLYAIIPPNPCLEFQWVAKYFCFPAYRRPAFPDGYGGLYVCGYHCEFHSCVCGKCPRHDKHEEFEHCLPCPGGHFITQVGPFQPGYYPLPEVP